MDCEDHPIGRVEEYLEIIATFIVAECVVGPDVALDRRAKEFVHVAAELLPADAAGAVQGFAAEIGVIGETLAFRCVTLFDENLVETSETFEQAKGRRE